jgi:hypothetical protein
MIRSVLIGLSILSIRADSIGMSVGRACRANAAFDAVGYSTSFIGFLRR